MNGLLIIGLISIVGITYFGIDEKDNGLFRISIATKLAAAIITDIMAISAIFAITYIIKLAIKIM